MQKFIFAYWAMYDNYSPDKSGRTIIAVLIRIIPAYRPGRRKIRGYKKFIHIV